MDYRTLEITLISADGIKDVNMFGKMDVYAVAFVSGHPQNKTRTKVDKNCGTSPRWNEKLRFTVDDRSLSSSVMAIVIQLKAEKSFGPDKDIGEVVIPISELYGNGGGAERMAEYQVRTSSGKGKSKGTVKISYKIVGNNNYKTEAAAAAKNADEPVTAYPPPKYNQEKLGLGMQPPPTATSAAMAYPVPPQPGMGYQQQPPPPPPSYTYPPAPPPHGYNNYGGYPVAGGYQPAAYGYAVAAPPPGYGYQPPPLQQPKKKKKNGLGMGLGVGAGLLGGLLLGDMVSDMGDMAAYNEGYEDAMGDASGFDF